MLMMNVLKGSIVDPGTADADADLADDADNEDDADGVHIRGVRPGAWQQPSTGLLKDRPKRQQLNALINSVLLVVNQWYTGSIP